MKKILLIFAAALMIFSSCNNTANNAKTADDNKNQKAKYIFLFVGDGMGHSIISATESYLSYKAGKIGGEQLTMTTFPIAGDATTYSDNAIVTCSAAAGTAIACGVKTSNGKLGRTPDGKAARSLAFDLKEDGYPVTLIEMVIKGMPEVVGSMTAYHAAQVEYENAREARNVYKKKLDTLREEYAREWSRAGMGD